ncbi:hypothetical protein LZ31DRAFT_81493 [Colletotrichum somersetense]|nr:hypothetical protein LZ31DRAFT_81493 [Colletotrichum somersetense]
MKAALARRRAPSGAAAAMTTAPRGSTSCGFDAARTWAADRRRCAGGGHSRSRFRGRPGGMFSRSRRTASSRTRVSRQTVRPGTAAASGPPVHGENHVGGLGHVPWGVKASFHLPRVSLKAGRCPAPSVGGSTPALAIQISSVCPWARSLHLETRS